MYTTFKVPTAFGEIEVTPTDGQHIHCSAGSSGKGRLVFREETYYVSIHLGLYGPSWTLYRDAKGREQSVYITRSSNKVVPPSYLKKITEEVIAAVDGYMAHHPTILADAEEADLARKSDKVHAEYEELEKKLQEKRSEMHAVDHALVSFRNKR